MDRLFSKDKKLKELYPKAIKCHNGKSLSLIKFVSDRKGHDYKYSLNIKKAKKRIGFFYANDFDIKLKQTIEWFIYNKKEWNE